MPTMVSRVGRFWAIRPVENRSVLVVEMARNVHSTSGTDEFRCDGRSKGWTNTKAERIL